MSESYVQVPTDAAGKRLRTWLSGSTAHAEAVVLTIADASGSYIDPRAVGITGSTLLSAQLQITGSTINLPITLDTGSASLLRWGVYKEPRWIEGSGSSVTPITTTGTQVWTGSVTAGKTGSIYGYYCISPVYCAFNLMSGSAIHKRIFSESSTTIIPFTFESRVPIHTFVGPLSLRVMVTGAASSQWVSVAVLYGETP
jgi:hypothetical protein